jgi:hypothetical protein
MNPIRWTLLFLSIPALHASAQATVNDHYTMQVDSVHSMVIYGIDTSLGPCTLSAGSGGQLTGDMVVVLHPGAYSISDGQLDGGNCGCQPDLIGIIPNSLPGLPPLLECHLTSLVVQPHSPPFSCDSAGLFLADASCVVTGGILEVSMSGSAFINVTIVGTVSDTTRSHGQVWIDGNGIHLTREFDNTLDVQVPTLALDLHFGIAGQLRADMGFPPPTRFCPATPNSTGVAARLDFSGTSSVSRNDGQFSVSQCPHNVTGLCIAGDNQGQVPFGNGYRCATGQLLRFGTLHVGSAGSGSCPCNLLAPPLVGNLVAGTRWNFQFVYRDPAAGGASFNASDALAIDFVP